MYIYIRVVLNRRRDVLTRWSGVLTNIISRSGGKTLLSMLQNRIDLIHSGIVQRGLIIATHRANTILGFIIVVATCSSSSSISSIRATRNSRRGRLIVLLVAEFQILHEILQRLGFRRHILSTSWFTSRRRCWCGCSRCWCGRSVRTSIVISENYR